MSRIVDRRFLLEAPERDQFEKYMDEYAQFCGVTVITHNVMSNHFHLLLLVPKAPETPLTDEELLSRIEVLSGSPGSKATRQQLELLRQRGQHQAAEALRQRFFVRMWDLSSFLKSLKQRFSQWYNKTHSRVGTLWEGRFKSLLVQSEGEALAAMAAYIDLNSLRAGLTDDPAQYRWCGYARACRGDIAAQESLRVVIAGAQRVSPHTLTLEQALDQYRTWLMVKGQQNEGTDAQGRPLRRGFSPEAVLEVLRRKGRVALNDYVQLRVRYFVDGLVIGSRGYVNEVFEKVRHRFGPKRKDGARRMRGVESNDLYVLRDLKRDPI
ncbi:MAG TPA: transposase, partial [Verrucomicrobiae bacterium]|nr:transposase [Verrucomicrobiae bacterium]